MPARSGDCTSVRNRASRSAGSAVRTAARVAARRALKVTSSILAITVIGRTVGKLARQGLRRRTPPAAVVVGLMLLDQRLHPHRVAACDGRGSGSGWRRRWSRSGRRRAASRCRSSPTTTCAMWIDFFLPADPLRRVVHDARRRDQHLGREQAVAAAEPAGAEDVAGRERPALPPDDQQPTARRPARRAGRPSTTARRLIASHDVDVKLATSRARC